MTIYLHQKPIANLAEFLQSENPAHEKLGALYEFAKKHDIIPLLSELGVDPKDDTALKDLSQLIQKIANEPLKVERSFQNSGVYHLSQEGNIAVFKIGRKRANIEVAMRYLSCQLGLARHMAPCMFLAFRGLAFMQEMEDDETVEDLFNGFQKEFLRFPNRQRDAALLTACATVGVVQPFLHDDPSNQNDLLSYAKTLLFAAAAGMRDVKADGVIDHMIVDGEDAMPERAFLPADDWHTNVPHTHLPYLNHENATKDLSPEMVSHLQDIVRKWNIADIIDRISKLPILFPDTLEARKKTGAGIDEGNYPVQVTEGFPHAVDGIRGIDVSKQKTLFTKGQLDACTKRLQDLQKYILSNQQFRPLDIVFAQDEFYRLHYLTVSSLGRTASGDHEELVQGYSIAALDIGNLPQAGRAWTGFHPSAVFQRLGAISPEKSFSPIPPEWRKTPKKEPEQKDSEVIPSFSLNHADSVKRPTAVKTPTSPAELRRLQTSG